MKRALVGRARSTRSATGEGRGSTGEGSGSFFAGGRERNRGSSSGQRFALRLRRRLPCGGPSIPLPQACSLEPNTARPGLGGLLRVAGNEHPPRPR